MHRFLKIVLVIMALVSQPLFAGLRDYESGYFSSFDTANGDMANFYWHLYLSNPTQANWDFYQGYVDGLNGNEMIYEAIAAWPGEGVTYEAMTTSYLLVNQGTSRLATSYRGLARKRKSIKKEAAGALNNPGMSLDVSYASIDDDFLGGDADDYTGSFIVDAMIGDDLLIAFGYTKNVYKIDDLDWEQNTDTLDLYVTYQVMDSLNVGAFVNFSKSDIEDRQIGVVTVEGTSADRWGGGLLASSDLDLCKHASLGITGTVASMNKTSLGKLGDDEDSAGIVMVDLNTYPCDYVVLSFYASYFSLLDREFGPDGSYFIYGTDLNWKMSESTSLSLGYETTAADNDHQEDRYNLGLTVTF